MENQNQNQNVMQQQVAPQVQPQRLNKVKVIAAMRGTAKLEPGSYHFQGCKFGTWNIPESKDNQGNVRPAADIPYLALKTSKGFRGMPLGTLYNSTLPEVGVTVGDLIADYDDYLNPISNLTGTLVVSKTGTNVEYQLQGVSASDLVE